METENNAVSQTTETTQTAPEVTSNTESAQATQTASHDAGKPAGYDPIDEKTATPEEIRDRLTYLYRQVKHSEREKKEMRSMLEKQYEAIDGLTRGQQMIVGHLQEQNFATTEESVRAEMDAAWERGDKKSYHAAQEKLMDIKVQKRDLVRQNAGQQQVQPQQQTQQPYQSAAEVASRAADTGELSEAEYRATATWQNEKDDSGRLLRPWAFASDPAHISALNEAKAVLSSQRYQNWTYEQKLSEIDRRMGMTKKAPGQSVMEGNLTKGSKTSKLTLSPKQQEIALRTKFAGAGKSDAEHLEKYRQQVEKLQQTRRK